MKQFLLLVTILFTAASALGQVTEYERVLIPVAVGGIPGAYGSFWETTLIVFNDDDEARSYTFADCSVLLCPNPNPLLFSQRFFTRQFSYAAQVQGRYMYVSTPGEWRFNLRVQDTSRQAQTWGTEIPVVREHDFSSKSIDLLSVPLDDRFRSALRIYDFDGLTGGNVRVRFYDMSTNDLLVEHTVVLTTERREMPIFPGYAAVNDIRATYPELATTSHVRISIEPVSPDIKVWAFVSVTNNETQHITTISPH